MRALYASELRDLLSATEQFYAVTRIMHDAGRDQRLQELLSGCAREHLAHFEILKALATGADPRGPCEPCEGMRWLVKDVMTHIKRAKHQGKESLDRELLWQYQRLSHYHVSRIGTVTAYAKGLQRSADAKELARVLTDLDKEENQAGQLARALRPPLETPTVEEGAPRLQ